MTVQCPSCLYATLLTNGGRRNISNRFVTKIEDDFFFLSVLSLLFSSPSCPADFFWFLSDVYNGGGTSSSLRCCDDATGTYMVIMWHGCRSRVVGSHQEALSYDEGGEGDPSKDPLWSLCGEGLGSGTRHTPVYTALDSAGFLWDSSIASFRSLYCSCIFLERVGLALKCQCLSGQFSVCQVTTQHQRYTHYDPGNIRSI